MGGENKLLSVKEKKGNVFLLFLRNAAHFLSSWVVKLIKFSYNLESSGSKIWSCDKILPPDCFCRRFACDSRSDSTKAHLLSVRHHESQTTACFVLGFFFVCMEWYCNQEANYRTHNLVNTSSVAPQKEQKKAECGSPFMLLSLVITVTTRKMSSDFSSAVLLWQKPRTRALRASFRGEFCSLGWCFYTKKWFTIDMIKGPDKEHNSGRIWTHNFLNNNLKLTKTKSKTSSKNTHTRRPL